MGANNYLSKRFWLKDGKIRQALKEYFSVHYSEHPRIKILDEVGFLHGSARIDFLVIGNSLHGYELKSDADNLKRLPEQAKIYNSVCDYITLVVGYRHAYKAIETIPKWWGIVIAEKTPSGEVIFFDLREPVNNLSQDPYAIVKLLWRNEALSLIDEVSSSLKFYSKPRSDIYNALVEQIHLDLLKNKVRQKLITRTNWKSGWTQIQGDD